MNFLPYHCPVTDTDHLLEPCKVNLARIRALREAHKHIGPLERCWECKGKKLEKKEDPEGYVSPEKKGWEPVPEVTTARLFLKDTGKKEPEMAESYAVTAQPAEKLGKKPPKKEETAPELPKKQEEIVPAVRISEKEAVKLGIVSPEAPALDPQGEIVNAELRYCPAHPEVMQRQDSLGRFMGMCQECLVARGRKAGIENTERGLTAPPVSIPLNLPRYSEIKKWLEEQADQNERTLQKEIMMVLKQAWRQGT